MHATDRICSTTLGSMSLVLQNFLDKKAAVSKVEMRTIFFLAKKTRKRQVSEHKCVSCLGKHTAVIILVS